MADYRNDWGPRWKVTWISSSPAPVNIAEEDRLSFEGTGVASGTCRLRKHDGNIWGTGCFYKTGDIVEVVQSGGNGTWDIKREVNGTGFKLTAKQRSATGASWIAEDGG